MILAPLLLAVGIWSFIIAAVHATVTGSSLYNGAFVAGVIFVLAAMAVAVITAPKESDPNG